MLGLMENLKNLSMLCGASGDEGEVRGYIKEHAASLADEVFTDTMGNLYLHKKGPEGAPAIAICAHMDEVGMLNYEDYGDELWERFNQKDMRLQAWYYGEIYKILENGELKYDYAGIDPRVMPGRRVQIGRNKVRGVVGSKAIHLQTDDEFEHSFKHKELTIDIGAKDKADAEKYVEVGDYAVFDTEFIELGEGFVSGKALDDRVGCAILMELLKDSYDCDFYAVFTVQEECGLRGASVVAENVHPDMALILEGTTANDMPDVKGHQCVTRVGHGPALTFMDRGVMVRPQMLDALRSAAKEAGVPYQLRQGANGGTDIDMIHKAVGGCVGGGISVPCRYIHSASSVASKADIEAAYKLAHTFLSSKKYMEVL